MKQKIGDSTSLDSLGKLLLRMDENEKARKCYERMVDEALLTVADARLGLEWAHLRCNNCDESLKQFEEVLQIREYVLGEDHSNIGEIYSFIGEVHLENEDYEQALIDLHKAIKIQEKTLSSNSLDLPATYDSTENAYTLMKKYDLALEYYEKTLKILYSKALEYYQKSLEISRKTLPPRYQNIIEIEIAIRQIESKMKHSSNIQSINILQNIHSLFYKNYILLFHVRFNCLIDLE
ncbi:unnamed protein product [Rotaria sp. Silwood1]|nr:unnamed protein product [Rotaria sp. Silwood1]CAF4754465.1 unnamed protein product [Rotaria sp. Silwood1]